MAVAARDDLGWQRAAQGLMEQGDAVHHFVPGFVPLARLNVFEQVRKTIDPLELDPLVTSIEGSGLIHPPLVALFDEEEIAAYVLLLNKLWGTHYAVEKLHYVEADRRRRYPVLIAGHRRVLAVRQIVGKLSPPTTLPLFLRFVGDQICLESRIGLNMRAFSALRCQFEENTYIPPLPHEEALAYYSLYRLLREEGGEKLSLKAFAGLVGVGETKVRNALRYCSLPLALQGAVEQGVLVYGIAVELARLFAAGCSEGEFRYWLSRTVFERYTVPILRRKVSTFLAHRRADQDGQELMTLMTEAQIAESQSQAVRRGVALETHRGLLAYHGFLRQVQFLLKHGYLRPEESPLLCPRTVASLRRVIGDVQDLIGDLGSLYPESELNILRSTLECGESLAQAVLDLGS